MLHKRTIEMSEKVCRIPKYKEICGEKGGGEKRMEMILREKQRQLRESY